MSGTRSPNDPLERVLEITPVGDDVFSATLLGWDGGTFGGHTLGCAIRAAGQTCEEKPLHSVHAFFLRMVPSDVPVELRVERVRDGRRISHRRVRLLHEGRSCFELIAGFATGDGPTRYQERELDPATPLPDSLPPEEESARAAGFDEWEPGPLEWRWVGTPWKREPGEPSRYCTWVRPRGGFPDETALHYGALGYLSDVHSHWCVARMIGTDMEPTGFTSLDTALWLHRYRPWHDWRLLTSESDIARGGRAFTRRTLHDPDGELLVSMAQEALVAT